MSTAEEQKQERTQLAAINEVIKTIASSLDLRQVFFTGIGSSPYRGNMMKTRAERQKEKYRIALMAVLLAGACFLTYYFHVVLETDTVFTHSFYIPIILASLWWGRKGLVVAVFLAALLILSHLFLMPDVMATNDYFRGALFVVVGFVVGILSDWRKRAEEELQRSEEEFRLAFENAKDAIFWAHPETGLIVNCNKAAEALLEKEREEIIGYHQTMVSLQEKEGYYAKRFKKHVDQGGIIDDEVEVVTKSGKIKPVNVTSYLILVGGKSIIQGIFRDISERKRAEEVLKASEAKYRRLAEDINDGYVVSQGGRIVFANAKMAEMLGYKLEELLEDGGRKLIPQESISYIEEMQQRVRQRRRVREHLEGAYLNKDGERVPVEMSLKVVEYEGEPALAVIVRDITERKRADEALQRYTKRVEALHAIAATVSQTLDLEQMLDGALDKVIEAMEVDVVNIYLMDEAAGELILTAHKGVSDEFVASVGRLKLDQEELERMMGWKESSVVQEKLFNQPNLARIRAAQEKEGLQSRIIVPLWSKGVILGAMVAACRRPREFTPEDLELLQAIASQIAVGIENARLFAEMSYSAATDELTGLYNHRYFQERLEEELARVLRFAGECSVIMLDLDHFKIYNDLFGHVAGDEVLKRLGQVLRDYTREVDIACRYGGEEFVIILPQTGPSDAYLAAERLRQAVEQALSLEGTSTSANLTVSLGVAFCPGDGLSREGLIRSADFAMQEAKERGRNQTCFASELAGVAQVGGEVVSETVEHLEAASLNTIYALAAAVDARDHYTYGHSRNVSKHAVALGKALGLSWRKLRRLRIAALLYDIGKIGLSDSIIRKPSPLDEREWEMMRKHSELGATIISHTPELADCAPAIRHHHEWHDGSGYPDGLKGEDIPLEARIIAVADAYDTMTTPRAYRETLSPQEALEELMRCANTQFDPQLVETFARVANSGVRAPSELSPL